MGKSVDIDSTSSKMLGWMAGALIYSLRCAISARAQGWAQELADFCDQQQGDAHRLKASLTGCKLEHHDFSIGKSTVSMGHPDKNAR